MTSGTGLLLFVSAQRAIELIIASRNTRRLRARGAYEAGARHYPVMVALHAAWLLTLWMFGAGRAAALGFVVFYALLQALRVWILTTLGPRWTTRILIVPGTSAVTSGPYRFARHPNYALVAVELPCVSLALGLVWHAILFGLANLAMLNWRIRVENRAFADAG